MSWSGNQGFNQALRTGALVRLFQAAWLPSGRRVAPRQPCGAGRALPRRRAPSPAGVAAGGAVAPPSSGRRPGPAAALPPRRRCSCPFLHDAPPCPPPPLLPAFASRRPEPENGRGAAGCGGLELVRELGSATTLPCSETKLLLPASVVAEPPFIRHLTR